MKRRRRRRGLRAPFHFRRQFDTDTRRSDRANRPMMNSFWPSRRKFLEFSMKSSIDDEKLRKLIVGIFGKSQKKEEKKRNGTETREEIDKQGRKEEEEDTKGRRQRNR